MYTEVFWEAVYWFSLPALVMLAILLLSRKLVKKAPFFFSYVVAGPLIDLIRLVAHRGSRGTYYYWYWGSDSVTSVLALLATCELALGQLFPRFQKIKFYRYLFGISGAIIAGAAVFTAVFSSNFMWGQFLVRTLHTVDVLRVLVLLFFLMLMFVMGRDWGGHELGIAFGLGVNAAGLLTTLAMLAKYFHRAPEVLPSIAYDTACIIWLITFLHRVRPSPVAVANPELLQQSRQWQQVLKSSISGKKQAGRPH